MKNYNDITNTSFKLPYALAFLAGANATFGLVGLISEDYISALAGFSVSLGLGVVARNRHNETKRELTREVERLRKELERYSKK